MRKLFYAATGHNVKLQVLRVLIISILAIGMVIGVSGTVAAMPDAFFP